MPERIVFPEWRTANSTVRYPFADRAGLTSRDGRTIPDGTFLDASFYVVGAGAGLFLSTLTITHDSMTFTVGDPEQTVRATATASLFSPPDELVFADAYGLPAGVLVGRGASLGIFQSWSAGTYSFDQAQTELVASVCFPTPETALRGFVLADGSVVTGDVWLVGAAGVIVRVDNVTVPAGLGQPARTVQAVRLDAVGDPLFRRRLCQDAGLFTPPNFVRTLRFVDATHTFDVTPDAQGNILLQADNDLATDTVLRLIPNPDGLFVGAVGCTDTG